MPTHKKKTSAAPAKNHEILLAEDEFIVSKTDPSGRLSYINRTFMDISGFIESELIGQQHNIIRHPDMPRGVFQLMWEELKADREFFGFVKNICKDGSFYWVFANVTPDYDERNNLRGYYSVRRKPTVAAVKEISEIYAQMRAAELNGDRRNAGDRSIALLADVVSREHAGYDQFVQQLNAA